MDDKCSMLELPEDIIIHILTRLSVRSLLRFKCVSKQWLSLISDPIFTTKHLNHRKNLPEKDGLFLIAESHDFYMLDLRTSVSTALPLIFPPEQKLDQCSLIWGSCDGLLLLSSLDRCSSLLVNPSTRESKILPQLPFLIPYKECFIRYNLGFDSLTRTYKILRVSQLETGYGSVEYMALLYNLRTSAWRRIDKCTDYFSHLTSKGVYLNGSLHWLIRDYQKSLGVTRFDLGDESFSRILFPDSASDICDISELSVLGDCLCGFVCYFGRLVVWVMKEYGVVDSWVKFTVRYGYGFYGFPLCALRMGQVLITDGNKLAFFNSEGEEREVLVVQDVLARPIFSISTKMSRTITYVESLVRL